MKRFAVMAIIVASIISINSCEKGPKPGDPVETSLTASIKSLEYSRVEMGTGMSLKWNEGDAIAVFDGLSSSKFELSSAPDEGIFKGTAAFQAEAFYVVYPFEAVGSFSSSEVKVNLPSSQKEGDLLVVAAGKADEEMKAEMKNALAYLELEIGSGIAEITVSSETPIAGEMALNPESGKLRSITGSKTISLVPDGGSFVEGVFRVAVAPGEYGPLTFAFKSIAGALTTVKTSNITLERGLVTKVSEITDSMSKEYRLSSASDLTSWIADKDSWSADDIVTLEADIDMESITDWSPAPLKGSFDGKGHCIYNFVQTIESENAGFFGTVASTASVKDVVFGSKDGKNYDGKSKITLKGEGGWLYAAIIARLSCSVSGLVNFVNVEIDPGCTAKVRAAGLIAGAFDELSVENCKNYGNLTADCEMKTAQFETIYGGLMACANPGTDGKKVTVRNCMNYGDVITKDPFTTATGGVVSNSPSGNIVIIEECHNYGKIANNSTQIPTGYKEGYVGGISGLLNGGGTKGIVVKNCTNEADLTVSGISVGDLAGIAGRATTATIQGCVNNGKITFDGNVAGKALLIGGIMGGMYTAPGCLVEDCVNNGDVTSNKNQVNRMGGIIGTVNSGENIIRNCTNKGKITIARTEANANWQAAGGIVGFQEASSSFKITGCTNSGEVTVSMENNTTHANQVCAGGIIGLADKDGALDNNVNTGKVSANTTGSSAAYAGGIFGWSRNGKGSTMSSSSDKSVCAVSATTAAGAAVGNNNAVFTGVKLGGSVNGTSLSADNVDALAAGMGHAITGATFVNQ